MAQHVSILTEPKPTRRIARAGFLALLLAVLPGVTFGQGHNRLLPETQGNSRPLILNDVRIDQKLGDQVPGDLVFKDETGKEVRLADYYGGRPIILALVYYKCPMLCTMVLNQMVRTLNAMTMSAGQDFDIVTVSFDPNETPELAAPKKRQYLAEYRRPTAAAGWHFLTGTQENIQRLTDSVGFRYMWDEKSKTYAHASGLMVLTPEGKISRYFYGIDYEPLDLRLSLVEASGKRIGSPTEQVLLYCFHYDPSTGRYSLIISRMLRVAAVLTVLTLGGFMFFMFRRDRRPLAAPVTGQIGRQETVN